MPVGLGRTTGVKRMRWGPYHDAGEATQRLTAYADAVYRRPVGVLWVCGGQSTWLRRPAYDGAGNGLAMLVRCEIAPPPPIRPMTLESVQNVLAKAEPGVRAIAPYALQAAGMSPEAQRWAGKHIVAPVDAYLSRHPAVKDGIVVVADVAGVIAGVAAVIAIGTVGGTVAVVAAGVATIVAGAACAFLLYEDVQHFWYTSYGNEAGRIRLENTAHYQWIQAIAPWLTLPDLAAGGRGAMRELGEAGHLSARVAPRLAAARARSAAAGRNLRETIAGGEGAWRDIAIAEAEVHRRARNLQRMQALAQRANRDLLVKHNGLASTVGGGWAARQYVHEPPVLVEHAYDKAKEKTREAMHDFHQRAERMFGARSGAVARPGSIDYLLAPSRLVAGAERLHLSIATMIARRPGQR